APVAGDAISASAAPTAPESVTRDVDPGPAADSAAGSRAGSSAGSSARSDAEPFAIRATVRDRDVEVALDVSAGETVALLGPNGAGKSTLLELAAGLITPDAGRAVLGDRVLFDTGVRTDGERADRNQRRRPHDRGVALLAQDALLFPHLTVRENVAFGPRARGAAHRDARRLADDWLARVGATSLAERRPAELSGGQAQRVAIARALATEPKLLLLDEPMSALDATAAPALRRLLRDTLEDRTVVIVSHAPLDAVALADRVALVEGGRIIDSGPTTQVLSRPRSPFAARLAGLNLATGELQSEGTVRTDEGRLVHVTATDDLRDAGAGARVGIATRPSRVTVRPAVAHAGAATAGADPIGASDARHRSRPIGASSAISAPPGNDSPTTNEIVAVVTDLEPRDGSIRIRAGDLAADVSPSIAAGLDLHAGEPARFAFSSADALAYPLPV
ncbi:MAG: sulfate/molybdate ABC transporter ATP-binding protein, partial [Pseudoclavibacter sp.]